MRLACAALLLLAGVGLYAATPKAEAPKTEAPPVLRKSPEFVIKFNDGHQMLLSSLKGKVVALLMVHTTCPHCQHTSQVFTQLYKRVRAARISAGGRRVQQYGQHAGARFRQELQHRLSGGLTALPKK